MESLGRTSELSLGTTWWLQAPWATHVPLHLVAPSENRQLYPVHCPVHTQSRSYGSIILLPASVSALSDKDITPPRPPPRESGSSLILGNWKPLVRILPFDLMP